jgi:uncharacterized membrane protein YeaQ/YmgE (transglycosylase-associated protein family)
MNATGDVVESAAQRAEAAAVESQTHVDQTQSAAGAAQQAAQRAQAAASAEPSWIYGLVVAFLGVALLVLIVAIVITSLSGKPTPSTELVSLATLILGGLLGVLAPTPKKSSG